MEDIILTTVVAGDSESESVNSFRIVYTDDSATLLRGWVCPLCKAVYGPMMHECTRCNKPRG